MTYWIAFWTALWVGWSRLSRWTVDWLCNANPKPTTVPEKPVKEQPDAPQNSAGETEEKPEAEAGEQTKPPRQTAEKKPPTKQATEGSAPLRWASLLIAAAVAKGLPWTTTIAITLATAWALTALALGYAAALSAKKPTADQQKEGTEQTRPDPADTLTRDDIAPLMHGLLQESGGVHLKALAEVLPARPKRAPWATRDVRALLARLDIRVRAGVRVPGESGREGVHRTDVPPLPSPTSKTPLVGVVVPGQSNNNNANNTPGYVITDDPDNPSRHTVLHPERT
ncbi:hypothetical protein [Streptomyces sp. NPDC057428]|uniref:hypothetical protein n=1 Tax=Streptomyces sp. NPDC057428 TaxID=3346129 RepID=UPI0036C65909